MKVSQTGLNLVAKYEGCHLKAYRDPVGIPTIGYGTIVYPNGKRVQMGDTITKAQANEYLQLQLDQHASTIFHYVKTPLNQNQFDALASFQYNLGKHILKNSRLLTLINNRKFVSAAQQMLHYNKAGGKVLNGLVRRRKEESELFLKKVTSPATLTIDGIWGKETTKALQRALNVPADGIYGRNTKKALQQRIGVTADGIVGPITRKALQRYVGVTQDGIIGKQTIKAMQRKLANGTF